MNREWLELIAGDGNDSEHPIVNYCPYCKELAFFTTSRMWCRICAKQFESTFVVGKWYYGEDYRSQPYVVQHNNTNVGTNGFIIIDTNWLWKRFRNTEYEEQVMANILGETETK